MTAIYEPTGRAREYSDLALNLYQGCAHACDYCFAPLVTRTNKKVFHSSAFIRPRTGILEKLENDAVKMAGDPRPILLSFTSDPYQPLEHTLGVTRRALEIMAENRLTPQILTKAGLWAIEFDADLLCRANAIWAATLTTDDPAESLQWEPGAALPADRIAALILAKRLGLRTWVSFEPVINPEAVYRLIDATCDFVDLYKVGRLNYHQHAKTIDWPRFRDEVERRLKAAGKEYYLKEDLRQSTVRADAA